MSTRRRYSDNDRADALTALDLNGGNLSATSAAVGVPIQTLAEWRDGRVSDAVPDLRNQKKAEIAERLDALVHSMIDAAPDKINDATLKDTMVSIGVAIDKAQLLKGQPTAITQQTLSDEDKLKRLRELLDTGENRASLPAPDAGGAGGSRPAPGGVAVH